MTQPQLETVSFNPIIEVQPEEVPQAVGRLLTGELVAFVTRTGIQDPRYLSGHYPAFRALGLREARSVLRNNDELGWHDDGEPTPQPYAIHDHFTTTGASTVQMFVQHTEIASLQDRILQRDRLEQGYVDTAYFTNPGLQTELRPGSRLFFTARGPERLKHNFVTTAKPRNTHIRVLLKGYLDGYL